MDVAGRRVTLMGLGRHGGGVGAARFLCGQGARLTITDLAGHVQLAESVAELADCSVERWRLAEHFADDFRDTELIVVNPAVRPDDRFLALAAERGVPIVTEIELFLERCPARVAAVTGTNGKSSTAAMLAETLRAAGRRVWLGGNIGRSLLDDLPLMRPTDEVVLELSSFQLARLTAAARGADLAIVSNCSPNHLDWHTTYDDYRNSKQRLLRMQPPESAAVLNLDDPEAAGWRHLVRGELIAPCDDEEIPPLAIRGRHQRSNARLAAAAASAWGVDRQSIAAGLRRFQGLPHRLELIDVVGQRGFYNDSLSTTPESTIAALGSFAEPIWLLLGGYDKGADFAALAESGARCATGIACYGAVGERLHAGFRRLSPQSRSIRVETLDEAVAWCWNHSRPGDVVLLSPACASYDQYRDYADRAAHFRRCVAALASGVVPTSD